MTTKSKRLKPLKVGDTLFWIDTYYFNLGHSLVTQVSIVSTTPIISAKIQSKAFVSHQDTLDTPHRLSLDRFIVFTKEQLAKDTLKAMLTQKIEQCSLNAGKYQQMFLSEIDDITKFEELMTKNKL